MPQFTGWNLAQWPIDRYKDQTCPCRRKCSGTYSINHIQISHIPKYCGYLWMKSGSKKSSKLLWASPLYHKGPRVDLRALRARETAAKDESNKMVSLSMCGLPFWTHRLCFSLYILDISGFYILDSTDIFKHFMRRLALIDSYWF